MIRLSRDAVVRVFTVWETLGGITHVVLISSEITSLSSRSNDRSPSRCPMKTSPWQLLKSFTLLLLESGQDLPAVRPQPKLMET